MRNTPLYTNCFGRACRLSATLAFLRRELLRWRDCCVRLLLWWTFAAVVVDVCSGVCCGGFDCRWFRGVSVNFHVSAKKDACARPL